VIRELVSSAKGKAHYFLWLQRTRAFRRRCTAVGGYDPNQTYWISPERIQLALDSAGLDRLDLNAVVPIAPLHERGRIVDGDWDLEAIRFEDMDVWNAFHHHFVTHGSWEETSFYQRVVRTLEGGVRMWGCVSVLEFQERLRSMELLFESIKINGYRSQSGMKAAGRPFGDEDEVHVHVGRNGDYIFADGRHRLCVAKILGVRKIPVKVARRHEQWVAFRREVLAYIRNGGKLYAPILHPDLADLPSAHGHERMQVLMEHLPEKPGQMLDIGAHWGYFCHCFEDLGYHCTAVENSFLNVRFMEQLRRAENKAFQIVDGSVLDQGLTGHYDVVLALNIFHHFLKRETLYKKLTKFLNTLDASIMFFEPHCPEEPQMKGAFKNYGPQEFTEFVKSQGRFRTHERIGVSADARPLFKLAR
jgi:2-polyprenyl-3-methyl-5-hydroxy-6-metoxy-1,4-benzoquinol methylase